MSINTYGGEAVKKLLLIEDDPVVHSLFEYIFKDDFQLTIEPTGRGALACLSTEKFDFCVIDLKLGDMFGIDLFKQIKDNNIQKGCIFMILTAVDSVDVEVEGHLLGITEYIKKPIIPKLLKAIFNKYSSGKQKNSIITAGKISLNLAEMSVYYEDHLLDLTNSEFRILHYLLQNQGLIVSREDLHKVISRKPMINIDRSVDMHVSSLRKKIKTAGSFIKTKRGKGYFFEPN